MTSESVNAAFKLWRDAAEKFDYFVLGATGAICAYVLQTFQPSRLGLNVQTLQLIGLLVLFSSAYASYRRLEALTVSMRESLLQLKVEELLDDLRAAQQGRGIFFDYGAGRHLSGHEVTNKIQEKLAERLTYCDSVTHAQESAARCYRWRNRLLFSSFAILVVAKTLSGYL